MSQFITCHETASRRPRRIAVREVAEVEPKGETWTIFSPTTITLRSGERVEVIEPPCAVRDMKRRVLATTGA